MEQAARDKARAEQEKSEYEVRTVGHCFSSQPSRWFRTRTLAAVMARMMKSRPSGYSKATFPNQLCQGHGDFSASWLRPKFFFTLF